MSHSSTESVIGSPEQEAFWGKLLNGSSHIMLEARAGTGKTFSCIEGCKRYLVGNPRAKVAMLAYNKSIATELQARVPAGVKACTMHSLGYAAIREFAEGKVKVNNWKTSNILEKLLGKRELEKLGIPFQIAMRKVVSLAKNTLLSQDYFDRDFDAMVDHYNLQLNGDESNIKKLLPQVLSESLNDLSEIDFDDMIWLPVVMGMDLEKFDVLFIDEAQDLNKSRQCLSINSLADDGRLIAVGDPKQAIYGFAGADAYSMNNLENELKRAWSNSTRQHWDTLDVIHLPLTVSRRCPKSHVKLAQKIVPDFRAMDDAPEGTIEKMDTEAAINKMGGGDLVLCRMNAPLMGIAYSLIQKDKPVTIQGRDIGASLAALCTKLVKKDVSIDVNIFSLILDDYLGQETLRLDQKSLNTNVSASQYELLQDKVACIQIISEGLKTVADVVARITNLFSDCDKLGQPKRKVLLSSVHRAKGLEAHTVFIVEPEKMPHPMATMDWEVGQEYNIKYVALTRSMDTLVFIEE